jgi:hypothetical protein
VTLTFTGSSQSTCQISFSFSVACIVPKIRSKSEAVVSVAQLFTRHGLGLLVLRSKINREDHPPLAVRDCLFDTLAAALHLCSIRKPRTRPAVLSVNDFTRKQDTRHPKRNKRNLLEVSEFSLFHGNILQLELNNIHQEMHTRELQIVNKFKQLPHVSAHRRHPQGVWNTKENSTSTGVCTVFFVLLEIQIAAYIVVTQWMNHVIVQGVDVFRSVPQVITNIRHLWREW